MIVLYCAVVKRNLITKLANIIWALFSIAAIPREQEGAAAGGQSTFDLHNCEKQRRHHKNKSNMLNVRKAT